MPRPPSSARQDGRKKARSLPPRIAEILAEYKTYLLLELGRGKNTADSYLSDIVLFCEFAGKRIESFADVDADLLADWLASLSGADRPSTQSRKLSAMRSLARFLMEEGFLYRCPAGYLLPYAKPSNKGLFQVKDFWKYGHFRQQTLITPQGKDLLRMMLCGGQMSMEFDFCESEA